MSEYQHQPGARDPDTEALLDYGFRPIGWLPPRGRTDLPEHEPMGTTAAVIWLEDRKRTLQRQHEENERAQAEGRAPESVVDTPDMPPEEWPPLP